MPSASKRNIAAVSMFMQRASSPAAIENTFAGDGAARDQRRGPPQCVVLLGEHGQFP